MGLFKSRVPLHVQRLSRLALKRDPDKLSPNLFIVRKLQEKILPRYTEISILVGVKGRTLSSVRHPYLL